MYCSSCGGAVVPAQGLTFCNHCGSRLNLAKREVEIAKPREVNPEALIWAIVSVFIAGIGVIIGLMAVMKNVLHFEMGLIMFLSLLCFLMMTLIEAVFIWRFMSQRSLKERFEPPTLAESTKPELGPAHAGGLVEPQQSVTDHTTRSFEPVYSKRNPQ